MRQEVPVIRGSLGSPAGFGGVCVAHRFSFLCCVYFCSFVFIRAVSCVPNVASFSGLSTLDCSFS